eukprot:TRINITY_DN48890_c0_g1_i1.p1 TRINITY_DN48890_c0_g1~~TRINITY_DN48890_c0_g1_i1.p1  ORF type:complete len:526 (+),score=86.97 TRINITY_DN48890_c0_g1_i1:61-1578(+)
MLRVGNLRQVGARRALHLPFGAAPVGCALVAGEPALLLRPSAARPCGATASSTGGARRSSQSVTGTAAGSYGAGVCSAEDARGHPEPRQKPSAKELAAILKSDRLLCSRVASLVDEQTAATWSASRESTEEVEGGGEAYTPPPAAEVRQLFIYTAVPFVGFGFFDNMIMLIAGDIIDKNICVIFGFSTLCAAGFGQMLSDSAGITLQSTIERFSTTLGIRRANLTSAQSRTSRMQLIVAAARIIGIIFGCFLGMTPLLFFSEKKPHLVDQIAAELPVMARREFMNAVETLTFNRGDHLIRFGELSEHVYLIDSGTVECVGRNAEGVPFHLCYVGQGHSFGMPSKSFPAHSDLIVDSDQVLVQRIPKDVFLRIVGETQAMSTFQEAQVVEHQVYLQTQGSNIVEAIPAPVKGRGKTRLFASLSDAEKLEVLALTGIEEAMHFKGHPNEGKVRFFSHLPEDVKHDSLRRWHLRKFERHYQEVDRMKAEAAAALEAARAKEKGKGKEA